MLIFTIQRGDGNRLEITPLLGGRAKVRIRSKDNRAKTIEVDLDELRRTILMASEASRQLELADEDDLAKIRRVLRDKNITAEDLIERGHELLDAAFENTVWANDKVTEVP